MKRFGLIINYLTFVLLFLSLLIQSSSLVQAGKLALLVLNAYILYRITTKDKVLKTIHTFNYLFIAATIIFVVYATAYKADLYPNIILEFIIGSLIGVSLSVWHKEKKKQAVERQLKLRPPRRPSMKDDMSQEADKPVIISSETSTARKTTKKTATKKATKKTAKKKATKKTTKKATAKKTAKKATTKKVTKKAAPKKAIKKKTAKKATKNTTKKVTKKKATKTTPKKTTKSTTKKAAKKTTPQKTAKKASTKKKQVTSTSKKTATKKKSKQPAVQSKTTRSPKKVVKTITTTKEY